MNALTELFNPCRNRFFLLAGPCVVESESLCLSVAESLRNSCEKRQIPFVFKASYKKANRSSLGSFTGVGNREALQILAKVKQEIGVPIVTDIHTEAEAEWAAEVADILQIPAFLCRQTDLLAAAAKTGKIVNIKKGQFMSAQAMKYAVEKVRACENSQVMLTERGTTFGYTDLVVDFRSIEVMKQNNCPVILDVTHALQQPNQESGVTGGNPEWIPVLAKAGIAAGVDGLFIETHPNPQQALSDGKNMLPLNQMEPLLSIGVKVYQAIQ